MDSFELKAILIATAVILIFSLIVLRRPIAAALHRARGADPGADGANVALWAGVSFGGHDGGSGHCDAGHSGGCDGGGGGH